MVSLTDLVVMKGFNVALRNDPEVHRIAAENVGLDIRFDQPYCVAAVSISDAGELAYSLEGVAGCTFSADHLEVKPVSHRDSVSSSQSSVGSRTSKTRSSWMGAKSRVKGLLTRSTQSSSLRATVPYNEAIPVL